MKNDAVYALLAEGLSRGEGAGLVDVARNLVALEKGSERATVALSVCLVRGGALDEAERVLRGYPQKTAAVSTNLAKVSAARGDEGAALAELAEALALDVNYEPGLSWWAALVRKKLDDAAFAAALASLARRPGAWRAHLVLYAHHTERGDEAAAHEALAAALRASGPKPAPSSEIASALARAEAWPALVALYAAYDPEQHGLVAGEKLVRAYVALGRLDHARAVLERLRARDGATETRAWREALAHLEAATPSTSPSDVPVGVPVLPPLAGPRAAVPALSPDARGARIAFAPVVGGAVDVVRAVPLALAEAFRAAGVDAYTLVTVVGAPPAARGFLAPAIALDVDDTIALLPAEHLPRLLVTARVVDAGASVAATLTDLGRSPPSSVTSSFPAAALAPAELAAAIGAWVARAGKLPAPAPAPSPAALDAALPAVLVHAGVLDDAGAAREAAGLVRAMAATATALAPLADNVDALVAALEK